VGASTLTRLNTDLSAWSGSVILIKIRVVTATDDNPYFGSTHYQDPFAGFGGVYVDDMIVSGRSSSG